MFIILILDVTNEEIQLYIDEVISMDNPQQLVTPERFGLSLDEDDADDQPEGEDGNAETASQYWRNSDQQLPHNPEASQKIHQEQNFYKGNWEKKTH